MYHFYVFSNICVQICVFPGNPYRCHRVPPEMEESLVGWVRATPALWDCKVPGYRDTHAKDQVWAAKAKEAGISEDHLRQWWQGIRDNYSRVVRKDPAHLTDRDKWLEDRLAFMRGSLRHRATAKPVSMHEMCLK